MAQWIKTISLILLAVSITAGTLWVEQHWMTQSQQVLHAVAEGNPVVQGVAQVTHEGVMTPVQDTSVLSLGDTVKATQKPAVITFQGSVIRLAPDTEVRLEAGSNEGYLFKIIQGRIWLHNRFGQKKIALMAYNVLLIPRRSIADIAVTADTISIRVLRSDITVGLLPDGYKPKALSEARDSGFINSFLVAQGAQAKIGFSQVRQNAGIVKQLLSSKLMKEFQYALLDQVTLTNEDWVTMNRQADEQLTQDIFQTLKTNIENYVLHYPSLTSTAYQFQQLTSDIFDSLTFIENKRKERHLDDDMAYFFDAEHLLLFNRSREAEEYLKIFQETVPTSFNEADPVVKKQWQETLRSASNEIEFVTPESPLFPAKIAISNVLTATLDTNELAFWQRLEEVRGFLDDAYSLAPDHFSEAQVSLQQYYDRFTALLKQNHKQFEQFQYVMAEENQRMDQLLRQSPEFYHDNYFAMKHFLETEWLKLLPEGQNKNEERQTIMSGKVDFLQQLQAYFLDQKIGLDDARLVALRLINEMRDLQTGSGIGIDELFALRLKDYGTFLRFLNASNTAVLKGSSPREKYNDFLASQKEQVSIEKAINEFLGQEAETVITPSQIVEKATADFAAIGVKNLQLGSYESVKERFITVQSGILGDVEFSALYDWDRKLISEIKVGDTMVLVAPTRLANLPVLLKTATKPAVNSNPSTPTTPDDTSTNISGASKSEKVAKILLIQKLKAAHIAAKEADITINDLKNGLYAIKNAQTINTTGTISKEPVLSFDFDNKKNTVSNLTTTKAGTTKILQGTYELEKIAEL